MDHLSGTRSSTSLPQHISGGAASAGAASASAASASAASAGAASASAANTSAIDASAMRRLAAGDNQAFNEIYSRYRTDVFGFLCRLSQNTHLADDLLQTVFLRVLQSPDRYDSRWPLKTWLLGIARNAFIDWTRKTRREVDPAALLGDWAGSNWAGDNGCGSPDAAQRRLSELSDRSRRSDGFDSLVQQEEHSRLESALQRLPWPQREAILLVKVAGLPIREAAEVIAGTEGMVKMRLRRGMLRLMELLGETDLAAE